jgi:MFS family permease
MTTNALDDAPLSTFHKKLALFSSGGPFLDGYVLSIIGVAMVQLTSQWGLSTTEQGLIGASSLVGILLGAFLGGWLTDKFGRQMLFTLDLVAIEGDLAQVGSALITILFMVGRIVAVFLVNRMGRRPLLIHSFLWAGIALLLLGIFPGAPSSVIILLLAAYAVLIGGTQILQWVYPNELFPSEIRGSAVGLASSISRIGAAIGTFLVPLSLTSLGIGPTMLIAAAITLVGALISQFWAPETRGKSLSECAALANATPVAAA